MLPIATAKNFRIVLSPRFSWFSKNDQSVSIAKLLNLPLEGAFHCASRRSRRSRRVTKGTREEAKVVEAHVAGGNRLCVAKKLVGTAKGDRERAEVSESDGSHLVVIGIAEISASIRVRVVLAVVRGI
jgi:hypothetical protein